MEYFSGQRSFGAFRWDEWDNEMKPFVDYHVFFNISMFSRYRYMSHDKAWAAAGIILFLLYVMNWGKCSLLDEAVKETLRSHSFNSSLPESRNPQRSCTKKEERIIHISFLFSLTQKFLYVHAVVQFVLRLFVVGPIVLYAWLYFKVSRPVNYKQVHAKWCLHLICNVSQFDVKSKELRAKMNHKSIISKGRSWQ